MLAAFCGSSTNVATMPSSPRLLIEAADALAPRIPGAERAVAGADLIDEAIAEMLEL